MKKLTLKKIVLSSIVLLSALILLLSLCFRVTGISARGTGVDLDALFGQFGIQLKVTGFNFLAFAFPEVLKELLIIPGLMKESFVDTFGVLFGIMSLLTLIMTLTIIGTIILALLKSDEKVFKRQVIISLIGAFSIITCHMVLAIIFNSCVNGYMEKMPEFTGVSLKTNVYVPLILQAVLFASAILCMKFIPEKQLAKSGVGKEKYGLKETVEAERKLAQCFVEYKQLLDAQIISTSDFTDKKCKLLKVSKQKLDEQFGKSACLPYAQIVDIELEVVQILKDYKKLLDDGIISEMDYVEKKGSLLNLLTINN